MQQFDPQFKFIVYYICKYSLWSDFCEGGGYAMHLLAYAPYPVKNDLVKSSLVPRPSPIGVHSSRRLEGGEAYTKIMMCSTTTQSRT